VTFRDAKRHARKQLQIAIKCGETSFFVKLNFPRSISSQSIMKYSISALLIVGTTHVLAATSIAEPPESTIAPSASAVSVAAATAPALSSTSNVKGIAFDRFYQIWLENTVRII
jgi:hypothetical protein